MIVLFEHFISIDTCNNCSYTWEGAIGVFSSNEKAEEAVKEFYRKAKSAIETETITPLTVSPSKKSFSFEETTSGGWTETRHVFEIKQQKMDSLFEY